MANGAEQEERTPVEIQRPEFFATGGPGGLDQKVTRKQRQLRRGTRALQRNIRDATQLERAFRRQAKKRAPVRRQIKAAARAFQDVENPLVRRQLIRQGEQNIRARRAADLGRAEQTLQNRIQAQQVGLQSRQNQLQNLLSERQQARSFSAQQFFDQLNAQRQEEAEQRQFDRQLRLDEITRQRDFDDAQRLAAIAPRGGARRPGNISRVIFGEEDLLIQDGQIVDRAQRPQEASLADQLIKGLGGTVGGDTGGAAPAAGGTQSFESFLGQSGLAPGQ